MKITKLFGLSILFVMLMACSKDKEDETVDIIGTWRLMEGEIEPSSFDMDLGGMMVPVSISGSFVDLDPANRLHFHADHRFSSEMGRLYIEMHTIVWGQPYTERLEMNDIMGNGTWEINGRDMTIVNDNGTRIPYRITAISGDTMEMTSNVSNMDVGAGNPMVGSMDIKVNMKLKKMQ